MKRVGAVLGVIFILAGCAGYMPVSNYAKVTLPDPVYVKVNLSGVEPKNGVFIKEELNKILLTRFHNKITQKKELSSSQIYVNSYHISYSPLSYDKDGLVTRYKVSTKINFVVNSSKGVLKKSVSATEDVSVESSSLLSSRAKELAIRVSIRKALDKFVAYIAKEGLSE